MATYGSTNVGSLLRQYGKGSLPDVGTLVGADQGFWSQPGINRAKTWGPSGPAYQEVAQGGSGAKAFRKSAGAGTTAGLPTSAAQRFAAPQGPASGLAQALNARIQRTGRQAAQQVVRQANAPDRRRRPDSGMTASGPAAQPGATMPSLPMQTLTKMVRGAY